MSELQPFSRLAPFLREFVYAEAWDDLRPIQIEAIEAIFDGNGDVLIAAGTASGKTEAAFLPILSLLHAEPFGSVRALYVGPLKALINDQFERLELLCQQGGIPVHRWHGDVAASRKSDLLETPGGVLQITPESIESLFVNKSGKLAALFGGLRFIVVDEVHSFLESDRGAQLRCQLERLSEYAQSRPRRVGLSATVGDFEAAKRWLNPIQPDQVQLINPPGVAASIKFSHLHFAADEIPPELVADLYTLTRDRKTLIFCNSRAEVETITADLNALCRRDKREERYLPHHGSISKEVREEAEARMQDKHHLASVVCTSTLELGIDIGRLDLVAQVNSTHSVMSFVQRLGRSGRRPGAQRIMQVYTVEPSARSSYDRIPFNLLKALAVSELFAEGWIEPPTASARPYNVLYQQLLSRLVERHGSSPRDLVGFFMKSSVFPGVSADDYATLLKHLAKIDHLQQLSDGNLILGLSGERVARSRDFYAVFESAEELEVRHGERVLGRISNSPGLKPGLCLRLAGEMWEVTEVAPARKEVLVTPAASAQPARFAPSGGPELHPRLARKAREILLGESVPGYLSPPGQVALAEARQFSKALKLDERQVLGDGVVFLWTGTRAAQTLRAMLENVGLEVDFISFPWMMKVNGDLRAALRRLGESPPTAAELAAGLPLAEIQTRKFDEFLPESLLRVHAAEAWLDMTEAQSVLAQLMVS
ncbi:MAG: DEAD/DEAH box helicase [Chloroflexi bacterium]|nr:DEAD/DEAH box helicase [Chloroflexota bacterium]